VDWVQVNEELKLKEVTLSLVWQEYRERQPDGYQYSRFCEPYGVGRGKLDLCMRQVHRPGEKLFVDYCGATVPVVDAGTGEVREAQVFVAVWGASSYTFAEATWSQGLADWIGSHVRAFEFGGGLTELVIPDNLRSYSLWHSSSPAVLARKPLRPCLLPEFCKANARKKIAARVTPIAASTLARSAKLTCAPCRDRPAGSRGVRLPSRFAAGDRGGLLQRTTT
jgi:transposase